MGFFIFYCFPGAYVNMDKCDYLHPIKRLRIYCGGVWHNLVLSSFTYLFILVVPQLIWPFYKHQTDSVIVQYQNQVSKLDTVENKFMLTFKYLHIALMLLIVF